MVKARTTIAVVILVVVAVLLTRRTDVDVALLRGAGRALVAEDDLQPADIVVVPFWADGAGVLTAADLIHSGIAPRVAVLAEPIMPIDREFARRGVPFENEGESCARLLRTLGVADVQKIDGGPGTTAESAALAEWINANQFKTVVVISTPDHSWRLRRLLHRSTKDQHTKVIVRLAKYAEFDPDHWWETRDGIRTELEEFEKLLLDLVAHPIS